MDFDLLPDALTIRGKYYEIEREYARLKTGELRLPYKGILSARFVRRTSKKLMMMLVAFVMVVLIPLNNLYERVQDINSPGENELISNGADLIGVEEYVAAADGAINGAKSFSERVLSIATMVAIACVVGFFGSYHKYFEITHTGGIVRVRCKKGYPSMDDMAVVQRRSGLIKS
ncbi:MAG: hypothetical protein LBD92_06145 [Oscillospiraceae bacterium]|nr:hypothetical protein [Oscillospiraceae bacterium]